VLQIVVGVVGRDFGIPHTAPLLDDALGHVVHEVLVTGVRGDCHNDVISFRLVPGTSSAFGWVGWLGGRYLFVAAGLGRHLTLVRSLS
jgi:hypothetical protein